MRAPWVLVVEDDASIRGLIVQALAEERIQVGAAETGAEALALARQQPPAAIILDVDLPDVHGTELSVRLRDLCGESVPILVVTAFASESDISAIRPVVLFTKPFDLDQLIRAVRDAITPPRDRGGLMPSPTPSDC